MRALWLGLALVCAIEVGCSSKGFTAELKLSGISSFTQHFSQKRRAETETVLSVPQLSENVVVLHDTIYAEHEFVRLGNLHIGIFKQRKSCRYGSKKLLIFAKVPPTPTTHFVRNVNDRKIAGRRVCVDGNATHGDTISGWCLACIGKDNPDLGSAFRSEILNALDFRNHIGPQLVLRVLAGEREGFTGKIQGVEQQSAPSDSDAYLPPSGKSLRLGGFRASLSSVSRPLLSYEIVFIVLLGAVFAIPGTFGLFLIFEDPNWERKVQGALLAIVCLPLMATLYGWGRFGRPCVFWGLCG